MTFSKWSVLMRTRGSHAISNRQFLVSSRRIWFYTWGILMVLYLRNIYITIRDSGLYTLGLFLFQIILCSLGSRSFCCRAICIFVECTPVVAAGDNNMSFRYTPSGLGPQEMRWRWVVWCSCMYTQFSGPWFHPVLWAMDQEFIICASVVCSTFMKFLEFIFW